MIISFQSKSDISRNWRRKWLRAAGLVVLMAGAASAHWPNGTATKWVEFPDSSPMGLDMWLNNAAPNQLTLADDFKCLLTGPITDIHLWISWLSSVPNPSAVFTLSIWSDVPAATNTPSHPGSRLWTQTFGPGQYSFQTWLMDFQEMFWNPDPPPGQPLGPDFAIFQYNFYPANPFVQSGSLSTPKVYWLAVSVTGVTDPIGWKTSTNQWHDGAVFSHMSGTATLGDWQALKSPYSLSNLDLSFALTSAAVTNLPPPPETNSVKYTQLPCLTVSPNDPECPNCLCYELNATAPNWVADDFLCTNAGPVTDIHLWGSWLNDEADTNVVFQLSIWSDVPATPGLPASYSHPGEMFWTEMFGPGQYVGRPVRYSDAEGFFDPVQGLLGMDYVLWQYNFYITNNPFQQSGSAGVPMTYWLAVSAWSQVPTNSFGWKISTNHYGDSAVFSPAGPGGGWQIPIIPAPNGNGLLRCDLAFQITTGTNQCPPPTLICSNLSVECGASIPPPFGWDNCCNTSLVPVLVWSQTNGTCPWNLTQSWLVTDCRGQTNACTRVVTVTDTTPPTLVCNTNKTVQCGTAWDFDPPSAFDRCCLSNVTVTLVSTITNGRCPWVITRTWKATDCCSNTSTCSQTVTVVDTLPPTISCSSNKTVNSGWPWSFDPPSVSDVCCGTNLTLSFSDLTNSPCPLTITRTWVVTDCCGLTNRCSQTVTVVNTNTPPAETNILKYVQWPQTVGGYDVYDRTVIFLADDFPCTNTGPINDIHIWCSYLDDGITNPPMWLGIWSDVPAVGTNASHPGQLLWQQIFGPDQYERYFWGCGAELYFIPGGAPFIYGPDSQVYYYVFYPTNAFVQQGTVLHPTNYWLSVYCLDGSWFGWKTTSDIHHDTAVWNSWPPGQSPNWAPIVDPRSGAPLDLAFQITTATNPGPPLTITCPSNLTVRATSPAGAVVNYVVTTSGGCPPIALNCVPPSGNTFPIGTTTVNCTAADACGAKASCSFTVTVLRPLKKRFYQQILFPPTNGLYLQPAPGAMTFPGSIILSNVAQRLFSAGVVPPPLPGGSLTHTCNSQVEMDISFDGGAMWKSCVSPAVGTQIHIVNNGPDSGDTLYGTELLALNISGGNLPAGVMVRESPTLASTGETRIETIPGGYMIDSFFDVYLEISTDGGATWMPGATPLRLELRPDPQLVMAVPAPRSVMLMPNGQETTPTSWQEYPGGILIKDLRHKLFRNWAEPPTFGANQMNNFNSEVDFRLSTDGGITSWEARAPATVTIIIGNIRGFQGRSTYDAEVTQFDMVGGDLPAGVMIRESPTKGSYGGWSMLAGGGGGGGGGGAAISSFFDVFTEVSTDGGVTWAPASSAPAHQELRRVAPVYSFTNNFWPTLAGRYICLQQWTALYPNGIVISNFVAGAFTAAIAPPLPGFTTSHTCGATAEFEVSYDGGLTYSHAIAHAILTAQITCRLGGDGVTDYYDTEMTQLDIAGGSLPAGVRIRESPTKASLGRTTTSVAGSGASYQIDSFFDVFTEVSTDNGITWLQTIAGPATLVQKPGTCPKLSIALATVSGSPAVQLTWDNDGGACVLQSAASVSPPIVWQTVSLPVTLLLDGSRSVTITNLTATTFFRLCGGCP